MIENENDEDYDDNPPLPKILPPPEIKWIIREDGMIVQRHFYPESDPPIVMDFRREDLEWMEKVVFAPPGTKIQVSCEDSNSIDWKLLYSKLGMKSSWE